MNKKTLKSYRIWKAMKSRCYSPAQTRGYYKTDHIIVCDRWLHSYETFMEDMGPIPGNDYSIERIDVHGNYCPENCKWILQKDQPKNRRNTIHAFVDGEEVCLKEAARRLNINYSTLHKKYKQGKLNLIFSTKEGK